MATTDSNVVDHIDQHTGKIVRKFARNMFMNGFQERRDLEQYFWTDDTVARLMKSLEHQSDCCCMATPSLAHAFHVIEGRDEVLLDINKRFDYLPKFRYWDILRPTPIGDRVRIIVFDPPFFYINMDVLVEAVLTACNGDVKNTKLMIGFLKREENVLLQKFKMFDLKPTNFRLEYSTVKPNKWRNYVLYSNIDLPGIKRMK